jgi:phenylalanyl-tRNA synthetase beta chain
MLLSKQWLSEFVKLPKGVSDAELAKTISLSTVEVERVTDQAVAMQGMVVGLVKTVTAHPNADRLKVCQVDVGGRVVQIVCGGTNVVEGMKVAVALPGSRVRWHGEGDPVELHKTKIRGQESEGMICAAVEIGIEKSGESEHEIMDLGDVTDAPGTPLGNALGRDDVVYEIEHKSLTNRPDLMGHFGMAREIAALYRLPLRPYTPDVLTGGKGMSLAVTVDDAERCPRYMAVALDGIHVAPSSAWLRNRLRSCGVRAINNVVDVTNFVMLELGQPMHAFDADTIGGDGVSIRVRNARQSESLICLDDETYGLDAERLLITDGKAPIAMAGVMGGKESAVSDTTTRIVFESANFSPVSVRKTSSKLALRSESSARFEKSLDPEQCAPALARAVELLRQTCPSARVASSVVDVYPNPAKSLSMPLSAEQVSSLLGADVPAADTKDILSRLGFVIKGTAKTFTVTVPSWRATKDISLKEDVVEEVARVWGYERIPSSLPSFPITPPVSDPVRLLSRRVRRALALEHGATETYRYAFVAPGVLTSLGLDPDIHLKLSNPLAADRPYLVRSLLPNLFEAAAMNQRGFPIVSLFEIDRVFLREQKGEEDGQGGILPAQPYHLAIVFSAEGDEVPFTTLRGTVEALLSAEGFFVSFVQAQKPEPWMHQGRAADIVVGGKRCGFVAEGNLSATRAALGMDRRVAAMEIDLSQLAAIKSSPRRFASLPAYPDAKRDLAFLVDVQVAYTDVERKLLAASSLLRNLELFDVYTGKGIPEGKKSLAVHLTLRADDRTLASAEADQVVTDLRRVLEKHFSAIIRM